MSALHPLVRRGGWTKLRLARRLIRLGGEALRLAQEGDRLADARAPGALEAAAGCYREALSVTTHRLGRPLAHRDRQQLSAFAARLHHSLGVVHHQLGELGQARDELGQALAIYNQLDPNAVEVEDGGHIVAVTASAHTALGVVLTDLGEHHDAIGQHLRAHELARTAGDTASVAVTLNNLGQTLIQLRELDRAIGYLERALTLVRDDVALRAEGEASCLVNLGLCYRLLAEARGELRLLDRALAYYEEALQVARAVGPPFPGVVIALSNIAEVRTEREDWSGAEQAITEALEISQQIAPRSRRTAILLNNLGTTQSHMGRRDQAAHSFEQAARIVEVTAPASEEEAQALGNLASVHLDGGRLDLAVTLADRAADIAESLRARAGGERVRQRVFAQLQPPLDTLIAALHQRDAPGDHQRAFQIAERSKARTLAELLSDASVTPGVATSEQRALEQQERELRVRYADLLDELAIARDAIDETAMEAERDAARQLTAQLAGQEKALSEQLDRVRQDLSVVAPAAVALAHPPPLTLPELQWQLDEHTLLLAYQLTVTDCYLWAIRRDVFTMLRLDGMHGWADAPSEHDALGWSIVPYQRWGTDDIRARAGDIADARSVAASLLLHPVPEALLGTATHLVVIPHGQLAYLPFEALPLADGRLLVDALTVGYAPSAAVLVNRWQAGREQPPSWRDRTFAGFGPATIPLLAPSPTGGGGPATLAPLPATGRVLSWAERFQPPGVAFVGEESTLGQLKGADGYRFVHLATHAFFDEHEPLRSELAIAPAAADLSHGPAPRLRAADLFGLSLDAQIVTCAGCSTGLGELVEGEGILGFVQALFHAGARCVVVSLWPVGDQPAARLMDRFYDGLREGRSPAEALRQAKLTLRRDYPHIYSDAFDWAGFIAIGAAWTPGPSHPNSEATHA